MNDRVVEADKNGGIIREVAIRGPSSARQLPDGNLVVSSWSEGIVLLNFEGTVHTIIFPGHNLGKVTLVQADSFKTVPPCTKASAGVPAFQSARSKQRSTIKKVFDPIGGCGLLSLQQTGDGGFAMTASIYCEGKKESYLYLIVTDVNGNCLRVWPKKIGGESTDGGSSVRQTSDGGFIISGGSHSNRGEFGNAYLLRTDAKGNPLQGWPHHYGDGSAWASRVLQIPDGGFVLAGTMLDDSEEETMLFLLKTDPTGAIK